ncbi:Fic family protein [Thiotrichales bacterium 19S3-7]|nr:Fic family protein [Thiotrichales bacterium 19S3-7]MCF6802965.1 Fic family protein [Thiotrichales bacterium 19S3-11]
MPITKELKRVIDLFEKGLGFSLFVDKQYWFDPYDYGYIGYAKRETNSVTSGLNALEYAFTESWGDKLISLDLLLAIHQKVTENVNPQPILSDQLRYKGKDDGEVNHIKQGIRKSPVYFQLNVFVPTEKVDLIVDLEAIQCNKAKMIFSKTEEFEQALSVAASHEAHNQLCRKFYNGTQEYKMKYALMLSNGFYYVIPALTENDLLENLDKLIKAYNTKILLCQNDDQRLELIFETVKNIELTHPFYDANLRTSIILLQRLLVQNGFMPTAFIDPNKLDNLPIKVLINQYDGQNGYAALDRLLTRDDQPFTTSDIQNVYLDQFKLDDNEVDQIGRQIKSYNDRSEQITLNIKNTHNHKQSDNPKSCFIEAEPKGDITATSSVSFG